MSKVFSQIFKKLILSLKLVEVSIGIFISEIHFVRLFTSNDINPLTFVFQLPVPPNLPLVFNYFPDDFLHLKEANFNVVKCINAFCV